MIKLPEGHQMDSRTAARSTRSVLTQVCVAVLANLASISPGMNLGYSGIALPAMQSGNHSATVTQDEASWIASLASIGTPIGCLLSGPLLDRWGRRAALLSLNLPGLAGWILLATTQVDSGSGSGFLWQVYAGRLLTGVSTGMASVPATVYVAEAADQYLRGMLVTWTSIFVSLGILLVYLFGSVLPEDWRGVAGVCAAFPVISAVAIWFLPESPVWLASRGRAVEAENSLKRLRGVELPRQEVEALLDRGGPSARAVHLSTVLRPEVWKPLLILNTFFLFQQISGVFVVIFYAVDIADDAGVHTDGYLVSVLIGATRLLVTVAISYASKRFGRRPLTVVSGVGMTVCMGTLAGCVYLESPALNWLPALTLVLYIFMSTVGFLTLPWAMIGELFPTNVRGLAGGITTCCAYLFSFAVLKTYPEMKDTLGRQGVFLFYGVTALVGTVFLWLCLPETQGKTLEEVEKMFSRKRESST